MLIVGYEKPVKAAESVNKFIEVSLINMIG
jgi:hypothetical protein